MLYLVMQKGKVSSNPHTFMGLIRTNPADLLLSKVRHDAYSRSMKVNSPYWKDAAHLIKGEVPYSTDFILEFVYE
jgi:hypothetical protein